MNPVAFVMFPYVLDTLKNANPMKSKQILHASDANPMQIPHTEHRKRCPNVVRLWLGWAKRRADRSNKQVDVELCLFNGASYTNSSTPWRETVDGKNFAPVNR